MKQRIESKSEFKNIFDENRNDFVSTFFEVINSPESGDFIISSEKTERDRLDFLCQKYFRLNNR